MTESILTGCLTLPAVLLSVLQGVYGNSEIHGNSWEFMGIFGNSWEFMGIFGSSWEFMGRELTRSLAVITSQLPIATPMIMIMVMHN